MNGLVVAVVVGVAGGVGAAARLVVDGLLRARVRSTLPVATAVINLTGSLLLGMLTGLAAGSVLPPAWQAIVGTGLLGGYTTFSTASFETVRLLEERRYLAAAINGVGLLAAAVALSAVGYALGLVMSSLLSSGTV